MSHSKQDYEAWPLHQNVGNSTPGTVARVNIKRDRLSKSKYRGQQQTMTSILHKVRLQGEVRITETSEILPTKQVSSKLNYHLLEWMAKLLVNHIRPHCSNSSSIRSSM